ETEDGARVLLLTDAELFGWQKTATRKQRRTQSTVAPELFFADVKPGDYVVHMEHGIGQYEGLVKLELGGVEREYLQVNYAQGDKLYVPVHQADRLSKYVGAGDSGVPPAITRLGTADWQLAKARAQRAVEEIAEDLLALYAERELVRGHAFSPDSTWQEEMEAAFPFQETEDQLQVIQEVKRDMESEQPMDRIIIGDVGYGKTEVAVRAAFKAVMDGKQVAVLVPTTVLAQQHFRTFSQRLAPFPVRVEMLSRFRTPAQQQAVLRGLEDGTVDIVIGTHRLLSQDVTFKDLGLLVVDEEQRFGVAHKERLKQLRTQVDVLTLSATPIPRTLHMSLSGVRDMSTITTPPQERLPVRTVLSEYDEVLVRQAIQRELERGGQVFFVHNRVRGLQVLAQRVQRLVPDAVVAVAHGQMPERALEETMLRFAEGEIDVLVCTTIVENGLDIRRANTMIINRADHFGLAQLYQLRGRVGRGAERGYCYLLHDKHKALSFDARRRLEALLESSEELGAGFRIAMRDLEIRGAGELLGARQHGQIAAVGFDLYTRLLTQAVNDLRRKKKQFEAATGRGDEATATRSPETGPHQEGPPLPFAMDDPLAPPVTLDLPFVAEIPARYVPEEELRLQLYRRIAGLSTEEEIEAMRQELVDRFGKDPETSTVPEEIANLFYQILVKARALKAGVPNIGRRRDQIAIRIPEMPDKARRALQQRLRMALGHTTDEGEFIPENSVHVGREAAYIPIDQDGYWRLLLLRALDVLVAEERATDKSPAQSRNA
ncbi:MAG: transcription-repair coupling factor, partial [Caldilineae bacterium]